MLRQENSTELTTQTVWEKVESIIHFYILYYIRKYCLFLLNWIVYSNDSENMGRVSRWENSMKLRFNPNKFERRRRLRRDIERWRGNFV